MAEQTSLSNGRARQSVVAVDREKIVQQALKFAEKKRYDKAIAEYYKLVHEDPNDARALLKIGDLQLKMEAFSAAVETYERVGLYYFEQGLVRKAIAVYLQIRDILARHLPELDAKYAHILPRLAELYERCGLTSDALAALDEVATKLLRAGKDREAIDQFQKIVGLDPTNPLPHLRLAEALARGKRVDEAIKHFSTAVDILLGLDRRDDALKVMDRLIQLQTDPEIAKRAAKLYLERGQAKDGMLALAKLQICFQSNPKDLETLALLARAFEQIGQAPKAIEVQKEMVRLAKEQGRNDIYREVLDHLMHVAPQDEVVRTLARPAMVTYPSSPPTQQEAGYAAGQQQSSPADSGETSFGDDDEIIEDIEEVDDLELEEMDQPYLIMQPPAPSVITASRGKPPALPPGRTSVKVALRPEDVARKAVEEAKVYRAQGRPGSARDVLRVALQQQPNALELREQLRDLLLEMGDVEGALSEIMVLATHAAEQGQNDRAASLLTEALLLVPGHPPAQELIVRLGYDPAQLLFQDTGPPGSVIPSSLAATGLLGAEPPDAREPLSTRPVYDTYHSNEPLPSYDLEEIGPGESFAATAELQAVRSTHAPVITDVAQDPSPLPSFRLEDEAVEDIAPATVPGSLPAGVLSSTRGFQGTDSIEDALEEVDFFASRHLYEDAQTIVDELLVRFPQHPLLLERQHELHELLSAQAAPAPTSMVPGSAGLVTVGADHDPEAYDISEALESFEPIQEARTQLPETGDQIDVEAVFAKFKEGVKAQVEDSDSATHYDLGVAYREMRLLPDAIQEFQLATRDPARSCVCYWMIGLVELERNKPLAAIDAFLKGLASEYRTEEQEVSLCYELGNQYENQKEYANALQYFERGEKIDANYRDISERIQSLRLKTGGEQPVSRPFQHIEDDFDSVFDNIMRK